MHLTWVSFVIHGRHSSGGLSSALAIINSLQMLLVTSVCKIKYYMVRVSKLKLFMGVPLELSDS